MKRNNLLHETESEKNNKIQFALIFLSFTIRSAVTMVGLHH